MNLVTVSMSIALGVSLAASAGAVTLAPIGPTYPVAETSVLQLIDKKLRQMEASGQLRRFQEQGQQRALAGLRNPPPLTGLRTAPTNSTRYFDPSFVLERNVLDQHGRVLFPAGTRKNPLDVVPLTRRLLFFDARDGRQLARARALMAQHGAAIKPVLVGGSYLELMKQWKVPVYYDQQGRLVRRFNIDQVPALVSQEGRVLRIDQLGLTP